VHENGLALIETIKARKKPGERVNGLTHCDARWLATVDWGTATAPIYMPHDRAFPSTSGSTRLARVIRGLTDRLGARP
jgi:methylthioribose-1-phosphate isomerase